MRTHFQHSSPLIIAASGGGGGGANGDIANITFESGTLASMGLTDGGGGAAGGTIISTDSYAGSKCWEHNMAANPGGDDSSFGILSLGGTRAHFWSVFALKVVTGSLTDSSAHVQKLWALQNQGNAPNQFGEMNEIQDFFIWNWLFTDAGAGNISITEFGNISTLIGQWHTYKIEYDASGSGVTAKFGMDGVDNMRTIHTTQTVAGPTQVLDIGGILNQGSGPSRFRFDEIHIGTTDPGWP
jgi:hypothetical protein